MSILHRRRQVKQRQREREACGERRSAPHEFPRASLSGQGGEAATAEATAPAAPRAARKRKAKKRRRAV